MGIRLQAAAAALQGSVRVASKSVAETSSAGSKRVRRIPNANRVIVDVAAEDKRKRAEEGLRTVMYLSCWGPN